MNFFINMSALSARKRDFGLILDICGLFVHVVHAFEEGEEGEEGAEVFFFDGLLADQVDELLAAFGAAGGDCGQDRGGAVGRGAPLPLSVRGRLPYFFGNYILATCPRCLYHLLS